MANAMPLDPVTVVPAPKPTYRRVVFSETDTSRRPGPISLSLDTALASAQPSHPPVFLREDALAATLIRFIQVTFFAVFGAVAALATVTETAAEVAVLPAASRATAVNVWAPLGALVLSQVIEKGAEVSSGPGFAPSGLNCTPATAVSSVALAEMVTTPATVAPAAGAASDTRGAVVSGGGAAKSFCDGTRTTKASRRLPPALLVQ